MADEDQWERRVAEGRERQRQYEATYWYNFDYYVRNEATMAQSLSTASVRSTALPPFTATPESPILCTSQFRGPLTVIVVGAGGTGARLVPPLVQMLRRGDSVAIVDHDIVEDRNLVRQHFVARDIGQHKAAVLAARYQRPERIAIRAYTAQLRESPAGARNELMTAIITTSTEGRRTTNQRDQGVILVGCVDNAAARRAMRLAAAWVPPELGHQTAYIDVGNEMRGGQVLMSLPFWNLTVRAGKGELDGAWSMPALETAMPQLLRDAKRDTVPCGERMDLQTVQVNHLAAATAINCLSWLLLGIPFSACGCFFSTLNTMQPIGIDQVDWGNHQILPTTTYANAEG